MLDVSNSRLIEQHKSNHFNTSETVPIGPLKKKVRGTTWEDDAHGHYD